MRALVTGGAGFVGSHMADLLASEGHEVATLDNRYPVIGARKNSWHLLKDLRVPWTFDKPFDWIFHFGGLASIPPSRTKPADYMDVNVQGTVNLLEAVRRAGRGRIIYSASSSCYGSHPPQPTPETAPIDCDTVYALSKYAGECAVLQWGRSFGLSVMSLRIFTAFGTRMRTDDGTGILLDQYRRGQPLTIRGDGSGFRDFVAVTDVCRAFLMAAESDLTGEILNVGTGTPHTVKDLVAELGAEVVYVPSVEEPKGTWADPAKIKRLLGWEPKLTWSEAVREAVR